MATQIRHILVAIGDLQRSPRGELRKAGILARAAHGKAVAQKQERGGGDSGGATAIPVNGGLHSYCLPAELPESGEER